MYFIPLTHLICNVAGMQVREGLHYNPYFPGGAIAMPKMLNDGAVEYEDGTPATEAQVGFSPFLPLRITGGLQEFCIIECCIVLLLIQYSPSLSLQMGKDIVSFLSWAAEPEMEERKLVWTLLLQFLVSVTDSQPLIHCILLQMGFKWILVLSLAFLQAGYYRRMKWSVLKSRKVIVDVVN